MACLAIKTEAGQDMIGIGAAIIALDMASLADCRRARELVSSLADMAGIAIDHGMHTQKRKTVIEMR